MTLAAQRTMKIIVMNAETGINRGRYDAQILILERLETIGMDQRFFRDDLPLPGGFCFLFFGNSTLQFVAPPPVKQVVFNMEHVEDLSYQVIHNIIDRLGE